jgi:hypothetical protein
LKIIHHLAVFPLYKLQITAIDSPVNCPYNRQLDGCAKKEPVTCHIIMVVGLTEIETKGLQSYYTRVLFAPPPFPSLHWRTNKARQRSDDTRPSPVL